MDIVLAAILDHIHQLIGATQHFVYRDFGSSECEHANAEGHRPAIFIHFLQQRTLHIGDRDRGGLLIGFGQ